MNYERQNFINSQIVTADNLNYIEAGLEAISANARAYNLLDNSDFKNPVNQRGATSYTGTGSSKVYTIDRWTTWQNVTNGVQITSDGILLADNVELAQYVPLEYFKTGKTYTFAAMKSNKEVVILTATYGSSAENDSISAAWEGAYGVGYGFFLKSGTYEWAALYEGAYDASTIPAYIPKGYAAELLACERYFQVVHTLVSRTGVGVDAPGRLIVPLTPGMRINPTVSYTVTSGVAPDWASATQKYIDVKSGSPHSQLIIELSADL